MKRPSVFLPHLNYHSLGFQTGLELTAGAIGTAFLLHWLGA